MNELTGKPIDRVDGRLKVTGGATYAAEFPVKNVAYGVTVTSTITKGRIKNIDTGAAGKMPGVLGIMTSENCMQLHFPAGSDPGAGKYAEKDLLPLQNDRVFYGGQHIAVVVAETFEQAEHAAAMVKVEYAEQTPVVGFEKNALTAYKPASGLGGAETQVKRGDADAAMQTAAVKTDATYTTPVFSHNAMEPHASLAVWEGDQLTVYDATQSVMGVKALLSAMLGVPAEKVRVIAHYIGGGFGSKGFTWANPFLAAMAARQFNRPVKIALARQQVYSTAGRRTQTSQKIALGADRSGKLLAVKHATISETSFVDEFVETAGVATPMLYSSPNVDVSHELVRLNRGTPCPMRAPGESVGTYSLEVAMDELAEKLNIDPLQLRLINHADTEEQKKKQFSEKSLKECYERGAKAIGWSNCPAKPGLTKEGRYLVGYGMATATYPANRSASSAKATLFADGHAEILCGTQDIGTGTYTIATQIAADAFGLPVDKVTVKLGDSMYPKGAQSGGSQVTASVGPPIRAAALGAVDKLITIAIADPGSPLHNQKREDIITGNGRIFLKDDANKGEPLVAVLSRKGLDKIEADAKTNVSTRPSLPAPAPAGSPEAKTEEESKTNMAVQEDENTDRSAYAFHSFGAQFVKVLVDPDLGTIKVDKIVGVMDIGKVMNLKTAVNQIKGGMIFGLGMALMENLQYDPNNGRIVTRDLVQYLVPVHADIPEIEVQFIDRPDLYISPLGARGIGEIGVTGMAAAIANAVYNATGKRIRDLPITPDKLIV
ncbi:xanthine dehydrogenase family protein molybdopterin-binding subunit [Mucilaginibacter corticis]|uniref:Xanthine dehydrogenase family protein molybdopterin-binding subunit n=1 Tax=Mucilaginibacter corticis TaxID=2597670 RepID=A0A556M910_9SPHI|nr:xanthine dehydrogenase family protein molybdopterin-binding subunit [Mucilaginibacter corticis]TSJ36380.1 xanthine dehydrogenase family protein molybdopterin-binding subunit [Mucilaginibacter corticis]